MMCDFEKRCRALVADLGLCRHEEIGAVAPLTGGVASEIGVVAIPGGNICVKFALAKLNVAEDWFAPIHRSRAEYAWLAAAAECAPRNVPRLYGWSATENGFAMEYLEGPDIALWKSELLQGQAQSSQAMAVADVLGRIHAATSVASFDRSRFQNRDDFLALRIEPYLGFTTTRHPDLAARIEALSQQLYRADAVLVHGDVSPKNILFRADDPILLDAECATMGDACFDVAFCLNHLFLKAVHLSDARIAVMAADFWGAYAKHVTWEDPVELEARVAGLLPALMLARVDGKSPVEYLSTPGREHVRTIARPLVSAPAARIADVIGVFISTAEASS